MLGLQQQGPLSGHRGCWQQRRESSPRAVPAPMSPGRRSFCPGGETKAGALVAVTRQLWWCLTGAPAAEPCSFQAEQPFWGLCRGCSPPGVTWLWPSSHAPSPCGSHELGAEVLPPGGAVQAGARAPVGPRGWGLLAGAGEVGTGWGKAARSLGRSAAGSLPGSAPAWAPSQSGCHTAHTWQWEPRAARTPG